MSRIASDDQMKKAPKKAPVVLYTVANRDGDTMPAAFEVLAILEKQYQDMAERVRILEQQRTEDRERLNAHGQLLTMRQYKEDLRKRMEEAS